MKLASLLFLWTALLFGQGKRTPIFLGLEPSATPTSSTCSIDSATKTCGFSYPGIGSNLTSFRIFVSATGGTFDGAQMHAYIHDVAGTIPDTTALDTATLPAGTISANTWINVPFLGGGTGTAGHTYLVIMKNLDGSPTTNYITVRYVAGFASPAIGNQAGVSPWGTCFDSTGAIDCDLAKGVNNGGPRFGFANGTYLGGPVQGQMSSGTYKVFSATGDQIGASFTTPANAKMNVIGCGAFLNRVGSPTGNLAFKLYSGTSTTPLATTASIPGATYTIGSTSAWLVSYFSAAQTLNANAKYACVLYDDSGTDTSSNYYNVQGFVWDSDSSSQALKPVDGTFSGAVFNGTSWNADSTTNLPAVVMILQFGSEFTSTGGGAACVPCGTVF